jgi:hypothetical protein
LQRFLGAAQKIFPKFFSPSHALVTQRSRDGESITRQSARREGSFARALLSARGAHRAFVGAVTLRVIF